MPGTTRDPFSTSVLAKSAFSRFGLALAVTLALWLAIAWAVALP